jgi:GT2 family glycosyltransferase
MNQKLTIGVASYGNPDKLQATLLSIRSRTALEFLCYVIDNPHPDTATAEQVRNVILSVVANDQRFIPVWMPENEGYAGAVNKLFQIVAAGDADYIAYCDNDIEILTPGWDEKLCSVLDAHPEVGWMFPGPGHYGFDNGGYRECLWNAGYCWIMRREAQQKLAGTEEPLRFGGAGPGLLDTALGHHEEVDFMIRLRLAGWRVGCRPDVNVVHHETATHADSADHKPGGRIHDGVVRWMNKWNGYFCGEDLEYSMLGYDDRALRYTDWNVDALYLERMTLKYFPEWNANPEIVNVPGVGEMEAVKVLKPKGCYRGRAI